MSTLKSADTVQASYMAERVILVDPSDTPLTALSKHGAHRTSTNLPLHRAFSLFIFDDRGRLLLQRRADEKITYPRYWANTVCSHPLWNDSERGLSPAPRAPAPGFRRDTPAIAGAKRAAIRKLGHELGVKEGVVSEDDVHFLTRLHYRAACGDGVWGEHEMDYILFARVGEGFAKEIKPQPNEVSMTQWVGEREMKDLLILSDHCKEGDVTVSVNGMEKPAAMVSPWLSAIMEQVGWTMYAQVQVPGDGSSAVVAALRDDQIHTFGACKNGCDWEFRPTEEFPVEAVASDGDNQNAGAGVN